MSHLIKNTSHPLIYGAILIILYLLAIKTNTLQKQEETSNTASQIQHSTTNDHAKKRTIKQTKIVSFDLPNSLRGTDILDNIQIDQDGNIVINKTIKDLFEYFLSASDPAEPFSTQKTLIERYLSDNLPSPAKEQSLALLADYIDYKIALKDFCLNSDPALSSLFSADSTPIAELQQHLATRQALRRTHLSADTADALFTDEEIYEAFSYQKLTLFSDPALSKENRDLLAVELEITLTAKQQQYREQTFIPKQLRRIIPKSSKQLDTTQLSRLETLGGPSSAERFLQLNRDKQAFEEKRTRYLQAKANGASLDPQKATRLGISATELVRMKAFDRIHALKE